jgi:hypothetical protein
MLILVVRAARVLQVAPDTQDDQEHHVGLKRCCEARKPTQHGESHPNQAEGDAQHGRLREGARGLR